MESSSPNIATILYEAAEIESSNEREAFLQRACGADQDLRRRVDRLLADHVEAGSFLEQPAAVATLAEPQAPERPGTMIGPYKLLEQIGEGGFGVVFMAEQTAPVKRKVALKVIKPGMDTRQVIARFEAERQALALMDHPNIARILDAGTTDEGQGSRVKGQEPLDSRLLTLGPSLGRPYFVMELVKGIPITEFCDQHRLATCDRLKLFLDVCHAVQHAHQKGVIHRDLKPSNLLVTVQDGRPLVKVIDFGIAKAMGQQLTDRTLFTGFAQLIGTPLYMSPEQAALSAVDVDTRSDVYSLGVLLYELLTGTTPFDKESLSNVSYDELRRIIREDEPPRPSARISTLAEDTRSTIAARHQAAPQQLSRQLKGELDWIVMRALEKDRERRYESPGTLAADVQRYLSDEPVTARPPSAMYRLRKFVRRKKVTVAATAGTMLFVLTLAGGAGWFVRDRAERMSRAEQFLADVAVLEGEQRWAEALVAAQRAEAVVAGGVADSRTKARVQQTLNELKFVQRLEDARMLKAAWSGSDFDHRSTTEGFAAAFRDYGINVEELPSSEAIRRLRQWPALAVPLALALDDWAGSRIQMRDRPGAEKLMALADAIDPEPWRASVRAALRDNGAESDRDAILLQLAATAPVDDLAPSSFWQLASELRHRGHRDAGQALLKRAQLVYPGDFWINLDLATFHDEDWSPDDASESAAYYRVALGLRPHNAAALSGLGNALKAMGQLAEAEACQRQALEIEPKNALALTNLGLVLVAQGELDAAIECYRQALKLAPDKALVHANLGEALRQKGLLQEAMKSLRLALDLDPQNATVHNNLGLTLADAGQWEQAIEHYRRAIEARPDNAIAHTNIGAALVNQDKHAEAEKWYRKAIAINPHLAPAHYNLGNTLQVLNRLGEAVGCWREAIRIDPTCVLAHNNLGVAFAKAGDLDGAIDCWRQSLGHKPGDPRVQQHLVRALLEKARAPATNASAASAEDALRDVLALPAGTTDGALQAMRREAEQWLEANHHYRQATALEDRGDIAAAVVAYRLAIQFDEEHARAHNGLGHLLFDQGQLEAAIAEFRTAIGLDPNYAEPRSNLGGALHLRGEPDAALAELRRAIELNPKLASAHHNVGYVLQEFGRLDDAIAEYRLAIELDSTVAESHLNLGTALVEQSHLDEAIIEYHRAIELAPDDSAAYFNLGNALKAQGRLDEAIVEYRRAIERDEELAAPHYQLGNLFQEQGRLDEATAEFRAAIRLDPRLAEPHNNLGNVLQKLGRLDEAIAEFRAALGVNPRLIQAQYNLGLGLHEQKKLPEAIDAYRRAIEIAPDYVPAHNSLGAALYEQGDRDSAIAALRTAFEVGLRVNGPEHASTQIARSNLTGIATNWSWTLATSATESERDPNKAVTLARLAADLLPGDANHWNNLGVAHYQRGDFQSAIDALQRADTLIDGGDRPHRMFFAMAHWRLERREQARELYAQGAAWIAANAEGDEEQRRFRAEAEKLMGIDAAVRVALIMQQTKSTAETSHDEQ